MIIGIELTADVHPDDGGRVYPYPGFGIRSFYQDAIIFPFDMLCVTCCFCMHNLSTGFGAIGLADVYLTRLAKPPNSYQPDHNVDESPAFVDETCKTPFFASFRLI
jgi:hypothetical protein